MQLGRFIRVLGAGVDDTISWSCRCAWPNSRFDAFAEGDEAFADADEALADVAFFAIVRHNR